MSTWEASSPPRLSLLADRRRVFARLPVALTPLVGREQELTLAGNLLRREDVRLLTITGPGGIGKTRLAIEVARSESESCSDGVAYIPLAAVSEPAQVPSAIRQALGVPEEVGTDDRDGLIAVLRNATAMLVLDNFEHVLEAAPLLTELLAACEQLKIVVTSRSLLRLTGEYALPVPPLILPDPGMTQSLEHVKASPSVRLFVDRVQATNPTFTLSDETAPLAADICRHLDGLPLAIELAAAQASVLPLAALRDRIQARLPLPVTGPRDAPARLRTIRDAVAWSYDLLTEDEKRLFRRISVFAGDFALDAAERLANSDRTLGEVEHQAENSATTLHQLSSLVEKSLLRQEERAGAARFGMLETIRAFARDLLVASGEADLISEAQANWVLEMMAHHEFATVIRDEQELRRIEADHPNILIALTWFEKRESNENLLRLATSLAGFWNAQNHFREGRYWLERALDRAPVGASVARGRAEIGLGRVIAQLGETERAEQLLVSGMAQLDRDGERDTAWIVAALTRLANLGVAAHGRGDLDRALELHEEALRVAREQAYTFGVIKSLRDLGDVSRDRGDFVNSLSYYRQAIELLGDETNLWILVDALEGAALAAVAWQKPEHGARLLGAAEVFRTFRGGDFVVLTDRLAHDRAVAGIQSALTESKIEAAWAAGRQLTVAEAIDEIHALTPPDDSTKQVTSSTVNLTSRETEVLHMLVAGLPDRAIAETLYLSVRTVEAHVARILDKLGVRTRTAAVSAAIVAGLVEPTLISERPRD